MAAARKRILRKEIRQPDRFMVLLGQCLDLLKAYRNQLIALAAAVVVVLGAVFGWQYYRGYQQNLAAGNYNQGLQAYREGRYEEALESFQNLQARGEAPYDALANLYLANTHIAMEQPGKAIETLQSGASKHREGFLNQLTLTTLGLAQEMTNACEQALQTLTRAIGLPGPMRQEAMLGKARCSAQLGKTREAIDAYKAYLKEFPEGETVEIAVRLQKLEGRSAGPEGS